MPGGNLPPGCEVYHIPGNRPEDLFAEWLWEKPPDFVMGYESSLVHEHPPGSATPQKVLGWIFGLEMEADDIAMEEILLQAEEAQLDEWERSQGW